MMNIYLLTSCAATLLLLDMPVDKDVGSGVVVVRSVGHHCIYHAHVGFMVASFSGDRKKYLGR